MHMFSKTGAMRCGLGLVWVVLLLGCSGWFSRTPVETITYHMVSAEGAEVDDADWALTRERLETRLEIRGYADAVVRVEEGGLAVQLNRIEGRPAPTRLFEVGAFTIHRVDELQSKGSDRVVRQALEKLELGREQPPETIWAALREQNLLSEDRWAFFSETDDGREQIIVLQSAPFIHSDLFAHAEVLGVDSECQIQAEWTARLLAVLNDPRMGRNRDRVAFMLDADLLEVRFPTELVNLEKHLILRPPPSRPEEGGRRIWEPRDVPEAWCNDLSAVLASGPLNMPLDLEEIRVNSP